MIQQPDLGKKIAELRKTKGLTQEELVDKCNLNVRTLQRIESGEVTPRTYTIRLIFEALDYSLEESLRDKELIKKWLEQFYISFIDLFNLKTNTMKKISILTIMTASIVLGIFTVNTKLSAQANETKKNLNQNVVHLPERGLSFNNFSCHGCFEEEEFMVGRDVSFTLAGVKVKNIKLIYIDKKTREFNALFVKGKLLERKVEIEYPRDFFIDGNMKYSAESTKESDSMIILNGNAKVFKPIKEENSEDNQMILADEIVIFLK